MVYVDSMLKFVGEVTVPGKVLLLGGYAILYGYPGLSIAIYDKQKQGVTTKIYKSTTGKFDSRIISRQFNMNLENPENMKINKNNKNKIVLTAYEVASRYLRNMNIDMSNNHYVYEITNSYIFGKPGEKSGLGSSAAVTVSLISAVLETKRIRNKDIIHRLSQISHALATGKIGSGFDIATAVYGTNIYRRFDKKIMENITLENFMDIMDEKWPNMKIIPYNFPYKLLIFNVLGNRTSTIKSVSSAKKLLKKKPDTYMKLMKLQADTEKYVFNSIKNRNSITLRKYMNKVRKIQMEISNEVKVFNSNFTPIEPPEFTKIIDKVLGLNLAVAGRCPGGGGYDSIVFITTRNKTEMELRQNVSKIKEIAEKSKIKLEYLETI